MTAACLVVDADRFAAAGEFKERGLAVAFNDVDLRMRLNAVVLWAARNAD